MDIKRYTIRELALATNTPKRILYNWVDKGYLKPVQINGERKKYSLKSFLEAERMAIKDTTMSIGSKAIRIIPDEVFENIEQYI